MPLYPYRCTKCGHKFEKIQSFKSKIETVCPKCGGVLERPLTVPGFNFKGAGWYVNDYASKSSSGSDSSDASSSSPTESKSGESKTGDSKSSDSGGKSASAETKSPAKTEATSAAAPASSTNS